ncbi:hypothetical protein LNKW23_39170 [Paralimibaculum aggregatum]|uniref:Uncharacterized protein n=1 Tax=Paralimibaculum aggregatum TaxID=3036245 RepID=A0ABQ6LPY2_9RHOB|nr:hypothetical protein LNKW23_39170 [Limibaculum sp. NKW23]
MPGGPGRDQRAPFAAPQMGQRHRSRAPGAPRAVTLMRPGGVPRRARRGVGRFRNYYNIINGFLGLVRQHPPGEAGDPSGPAEQRPDVKQAAKPSAASRRYQTHKAALPVPVRSGAAPGIAKPPNRPASASAMQDSASLPPRARPASTIPARSAARMEAAGPPPCCRRKSPAPVLAPSPGRAGSGRRGAARPRPQGRRTLPQHRGADAPAGHRERRLRAVPGGLVVAGEITAGAEEFRRGGGCARPAGKGRRGGDAGAVGHLRLRERPGAPDGDENGTAAGGAPRGMGAVPAPPGRHR